MLILKTILLILIFSTATLIGLTISKKYQTRVKNLKEMQRALHIFEEKIKYTYETIPDLFLEISEKTSNSISQIFEESSKNMKDMSAGEAWELALDNSKTKLNKEDIEILKGLAKMLGRTDLDGQVNEIKLTQKFIDTKIEDAEIERRKNEKLYKTLGVTLGLGLVIILI